MVSIVTLSQRCLTGDKDKAKRRKSNDILVDMQGRDNSLELHIY